MDATKPCKLSDIEQHKLNHLLESSYITIVGIGDFGAAVLYKLMKYQAADAENLICSNFVHISQVDYEKVYYYSQRITDGLVSETELVLVVGDCDDPICLEVCGKLSKTFQGKFIVCFLCGTENNAVLPSVDAVVQINEDIHEAFLAVRLFPDILTRAGLIGIDLLDVTGILKLCKKFKVHDLNFTKEELKNDKDLIHDLFPTGSGISGIYGDKQFEMIWVDKIAKLITKNGDRSEGFVLNALIDGPDSDEVKLVTLFSPEQIVHAW